jgi:hypothetical protein
MRNSQTISLNEIDYKTARSFLSHIQVFKVKQSDYQELVNQYANSK